MSAELIAWLYASSLSTAIRDMLWVVPTVQSVHIIAIAALLGSAVISDLRLAGVPVCLLYTSPSPRDRG